MRIRVRSGGRLLRLEGGDLRELPSEGVALTSRRYSGPSGPGVRVGSVIIESADDDGIGPLLRVRLRFGCRCRPPIPQGCCHRARRRGARMIFQADTGRGVRREVNTLGADGVALMALHEPVADPSVNVPLTVAGHGAEAGIIEIDARDVRPGQYEVVVGAPPNQRRGRGATVSRSPVRLGGRMRDSLVVRHVRSSKRRLSCSCEPPSCGRMAGGDEPFDPTPRTLHRDPTGARQLVVDVAMAEAEWSRFTISG